MKAATKKTTPRTVKKTAATTTVRRSKSTKKAPASAKVDYYPNRMTFLVSAAAGSLLVLITVICVYGNR